MSLKDWKEPSFDVICFALFIITHCTKLPLNIKLVSDCQKWDNTAEPFALHFPGFVFAVVFAFLFTLLFALVFVFVFALVFVSALLFISSPGLPLGKESH